MVPSTLETRNEGSRRHRGSGTLGVGVVVIVFELLAVVLLQSGVRVPVSIGVAFTGAVIVSSRRYLARYGGYAGTRTWNWIERIVPALVRRAKDRRTYQFSLRTLLIFVLVVACVCAWYGHRLQKVREEWSLLNGQWRMVHEDGTPVVLRDGKQVLFILDETRCKIYRNHEPRWLDFNDATRPGRGISKCVYRLEGQRLRVAQASPGLRRPTSFDPHQSLQPEPGARAGTGYSLSVYLLERIADNEVASTPGTEPEQ